MPRVNVIQTNFTAGEISPRMKGRVDVERYRNGAEIVENGVPVVHGGVDRRGGFRYLATAKLGGARRVRVIRYVFNAQQAYILEFGHLYVRVFASNGAQVLDESLAPLEIASPYTEDQLAALTTRQGGDTMFVFHPDVPTHRLRRLTATLWTFDPVPWVAEPFAELGANPPLRLSLSSATVGAGRTFTTAPVTVPDAPTIGTAAALNGAASVSFTPPADDGGLPPDLYTATSSPGGITGTGADSPIRVDGLTNGTDYTFTVVAHNTVGDSAASAASNTVTPNASAPSDTLEVSATPLFQRFIATNGFRGNIAGPTASGTNGTAPYTYAWTKLSGAAGIVITTANQAQVKFSSTNYSASNFAGLRCTVTDALGQSGSVDVTVQVDHQAVDGGAP